MLPDLHDAARGRWRGILAHFGLSQKELSGKHCPCPMCGGTDRFRFDDKEGRGTWICNNCGAGSGVDLVMKLRNWSFKEAAEAVRPLVGVAAPEPVKAGMTEQQKRDMRLAIWKASAPVRSGDPVDAYLVGRGADRPAYEPSLRYCPSLRYAEGKSFPGMVAAVQEPGGQCVSLHRTFLLDGHKAPVDDAKRLTPGEIPDGSAIRLAPVMSVMGVAEGIETALAAWNMFGVPTWATVSGALMAKWEPPAGVSEVIIYGDNDPSFAGQAAAYTLARRLVRKGLKARVQIPEDIGTDWADHVGEDA